MDEDKSSPKYAKLLAEYTKVSYSLLIASLIALFSLVKTKILHFISVLLQLRTQAKVLKNAVVEERNKVSVLQESLRIKDQNFRRLETEFDSINFRNKQLEHRVASLQDDLQASQKTGKASKARNDNQVSGNGQIDPILAEELQKKIIESATLASAVS
jgi:predicted  nucleic acid-binding Zn-ribbon protein